MPTVPNIEKSPSGVADALRIAALSGTHEKCSADLNDVELNIDCYNERVTIADSNSDYFKLPISVAPTACAKIKHERSVVAESPKLNKCSQNSDVMSTPDLLNLLYTDASILRTPIISTASEFRSVPLFVWSPKIETPNCDIIPAFLATPALIKATTHHNSTIDIINMIDDESSLFSNLDNELISIESSATPAAPKPSLFTEDLGHCNTAIPAVSRGKPSVFHRLPTRPAWHTSLLNTEQPVKVSQPKCGRHCKRLPHEMEDAIIRRQKEQREEEILKRRTRGKNKFRRESNEEVVQRRVKANGPKTRSLLRAAQDIGKTENDLAVMYTSREQDIEE